MSDTRLTRRLADLYAADPQVRAAAPIARLTEQARRPGRSALRIVAGLMEGYADRPALGERATEPVKDPATGRTSRRLLPRFDTVSYGELWERVGAIAAEWHHDPHDPLRAGDLVAFVGFGSADYVMADLACLRLGAVCVPLQAGGAVGQLRSIVEETAARAVAASVEHLDAAVEIALSGESVRRLIVLDHHPDVDDERERVESARARLAQAGGRVALTLLADVLERGRALPPAPEPPTDPAGARLSLLVYTSGSTGTPKGAMYTDRLVAELWRGLIPDTDGVPNIRLNYLPMSHMMGRVTLYATFTWGGTAYFVARSDLSTLFDDIALVRPTIMEMVPRICDVLFQRYQSMLDAGPGADRAALEAEARAEVRERLLGGRLLWTAYGSAPLSAELESFVEEVLELRFHNIYGSTEAGLVLLDRRIGWEHVLEHRLADIPELGYFRTDSPYPRGELLLKSRTLIPGYFKRPDVTAEVFDADGFYRTGDVMAEVAPGEYVYVDRRTNVLKLSQGEFVAVSRLEALFAASPVVRQIYVDGSSERSHLLAVVVPTPEALERAGGDPERVKLLVGESLRRIARSEDLNSYEIPRGLLIETDPFTPENGLLTGARKLRRPRLRERYGRRLEQLYAELAERETDELHALRTAGRDRPVLETVVRAARAVVGSAAGEVTPDLRFTELGGDSVSALTFSALLREIFEVDVPVGVVLNPVSDLRSVAGHVERALAADAADAAQPTFATVHSAGSTSVRAADLRLDRFVDAETLARAKALPRPHGEPRTVLLTGANGYLGRFVCLEWLERLAPAGGRLICLVRGGGADQARARLDAAFDSGDAGLARHFRELAAGHLEVIDGDLGEPDLGLDPPAWQRLAESVDAIVHPGALVNHVLPYDQLFGPNVVGTARLIRLALTARLKPITFVSTAAVMFEQVTAVDEQSDIRSVSPARVLDGGYANGYTISKWACEVLLREAHDAFGLPVTVFRSDMILAHSAYAGQLNVPDMFTRLLLSLIATGIAPGSFYRAAGRAHYDGLPADFTAYAVAALGAADGYTTYHLLNPHDDGISLDTYVDWLVDAGCAIKRVDDYREWLGRFETALRALPDRQRQHSLLPLLHAFAQPDDAIAGSRLPAGGFQAAVRENGGDIPHVTPELIRKYVDDLRRLRLI